MFVAISQMQQQRTWTPVPVSRAMTMFEAPPPPPPPVDKTRRRLVWFVFALSFVPYFLPVEYQPTFYRDGKTPSEIEQSRQTRRLNKILGGDITKTEFGAELIQGMNDG